MELERTWFVSEKDDDDVITICKFIMELPDRIELLINKDTSNFKLIADSTNDENLSYASFEKAFDESKAYFKKSNVIIDRILKINKLLDKSKKSKDEVNEYNLFTKELESAGLTKQQLKVKFAMMNRLWLNMCNYIGKTKDKIINFLDNELMELVRGFMAFLNSFLSSIITAIGAIIPGIESIKEMKDLIEGYSDFAVCPA